jgi:hypothetical protein
LPTTPVKGVNLNVLRVLAISPTPATLAQLIIAHHISFNIQHQYVQQNVHMVNTKTSPNTNVDYVTSTVLLAYY